MTVRLSVQAFDLHDRAARARGLTLTHHLAGLLEAIDPELVETLQPPPAIDELAERRAQQLAVLRREGLLDAAAASMLELAVLPKPLQAAHAAARRGGPGWRWYGVVLGEHLHALLSDHREAIDAIAAEPHRDAASTLLDKLIRAHAPEILNCVERRHLATVIAAALDEVTSQRARRSAS